PNIAQFLSCSVLIDRGFIDVNGIPNEGADFIDPWGNPYNFVVRDGAIEVFTFGQNGKSTSNGKDLDDINSWDEMAPWREFYPPPSGENEIVVLVPLVVFILIIGVLISFRFLRIRVKLSREPLC